MTAINFPDSPLENEVFTSGTRSWKYVGGVWQTVTTAAGSQGDKAGLQYKFDSVITMSAPDQGFLRFNNSNIFLATSIAINSSTIEGTNVLNYITEVLASSSAVDGHIIIQSNVNNDPTYAIFAIAGIVDYATWLEMSVTYLSGTLPVDQEDLVVGLTRTGDLGPTGPTGPGGTYNYRVTPTAPTLGSNNGQLVDGDTWFNSETGRFYIYYDSYWIENTSSLVGAGSGGAGGSSIQVSDIEPLSPSEGDVWFNSNQGRSYIYYDNFWVDLNPSIEGPTGPTGPPPTVSSNSPITLSGIDNSIIGITVGPGGVQEYNANIASFASLPDSSGVLRNNGSGVLSYDNTVLLPGSIVSDTTLGTAASGVGFKGLPQISTANGLIITAAHSGKHVYTTATGQTHTIPANVSTAFPIGTSIVFINPASVSCTIAITSDTLILVGTGATGTRSLSAYGMATAVKVTATSWMISGNGLT